MGKKELRKELELTLVKTIEDVLKGKNAGAALKIRKATFSASKSIAKKFYKTLKTALVKNGLEKKAIKKAKTGIKKPVKQDKTNKTR